MTECILSIARSPAKQGPEKHCHGSSRRGVGCADEACNAVHADVFSVSRDRQLVKPWTGLTLMRAIGNRTPLASLDLLYDVQFSQG